MADVHHDWGLPVGVGCRVALGTEHWGKRADFGSGWIKRALWEKRRRKEEKEKKKEKREKKEEGRERKELPHRGTKPRTSM